MMIPTLRTYTRYLSLLKTPHGDSKEKLNFNRGRFNEFIYNVVENMRAELKKEFIENG